MKQLDTATAQDGAIRVRYRVIPRAVSIEELARRIAYEQTVELPVTVVDDPHVLANVVGQVHAITACAGDDNDGTGGTGGTGRTGGTGASSYWVDIDFSSSLANGQLSQLLNLIFGNVSLYPGVRLVSLALPPSVLAALPGPQFGVKGIRRMVGVDQRPLLATAIKPRGLDIDDLADIAYRFARGGGDLIKDDQNLVDDFETFKERVSLCRDAVWRANDETGHRCQYFPHVSAEANAIERYLDFVFAIGLEGVLVCPQILGLDRCGSMLRGYPLAMMAHPALTGSYLIHPDHGIHPAVLLGQLFRLAGADLSIFPHHQGRFAFERSACTDIAQALGSELTRSDGSKHLTTMPVPAGGMQLSVAPELAQDYGKEACWLIGGALFEGGADLETTTREFRAELEGLFPDDALGIEPSHSGDRSAPSGVLIKALVASISDAGSQGLNWASRESSPYKDGAEPAFRGVRRVELVGKFAEPTRYDLRYFEVQPDGYTSLERHVHTHIIIGAHGAGVLRLGNEERPIGPHDVAFVAPLEVHQLSNRTQRPFGFYCIVDHERDRPIAS